MVDFKKLEDACTEYTVLFFQKLPSDAVTEPKEQTNACLPELANGLAIIARQAGIETHLSTPEIKDVWTDATPEDGIPATYGIEVNFLELGVFWIPVLPRGAA